MKMQNTLKTLLVFALMLMIGVISQAQDNTLSLPSADGAQTIYPITLQSVSLDSYDRDISFKTEMPQEAMDKIRIKYRDIVTGEIIILKTNGAGVTCYNSGPTRFCIYDATNEDLMKFTDNHVYKWQVLISEMVDGVAVISKSNKTNIEVELIAPAEALAVIDGGDTRLFSWRASGTVDKYVIKIINTNNGNLVYSQAITVEEPQCYDGMFLTCEIPMPTLKDGVKYRWHVVAKNSFGSIRSEKSSFIY